MKTLLLTILFGIMCLTGYAQSQDKVSYGYDLAGNRTSRVINYPSQSQSPPLPLQSTEEAVKEEPVREPEEEPEKEPEEQKIHSEMLEDFSVRIYPNPTKGELTVEMLQLPEGATATIRLFSMSGSLILQKTGISNIEHFNIGNQPAGIYLLRIAAGKSSTEWKIIKQ